MMERLKKYLEFAFYLNIGIFMLFKFGFKNVWLDAISYSVTITSFICASYCTFVWRCNPLEKYPKLNKKYKGIIKTEAYGERDIEVEIKHNLIYTHIKMKSKESTSKSQAFNIYQDGEDWALVYTYINEPKMLERGHSDIHYGTCVLEITDKDRLIGKYYTDRKTVGEIELISANSKEMIKEKSKI